MNSKCNDFMKWFFCLDPETPTIEDPYKKLLMSMNVTSKSRYNASMRLRKASTVSFLTTTCLSLGLILIPLLQNSEIKLVVNNKTLNMMQIFMAVAILVYSIINSKANYDVRAEKLNLCGDMVKELYRELDNKITKGEAVDYDELLSNYNDITRDSENHTRLDYLLTKLQLGRYYKITGLKYVSMKIFSLVWQVMNMSASFVLLAVEALFITEMIGMTHLSKFFINT